MTTNFEVEKVILSYNGIQDVPVNRNKIANSCVYFYNLLSSQFLEGSKSRIELYVNDSISFEVFESVVKFAENRIFDKTKSLQFYIKMLQLADSWILNSLMAQIELHLSNKIDKKTLVLIHTTANLYNLTNLKNDCLRFERAVDLNMSSDTDAFWQLDR